MSRPAEVVVHKLDAEGGEVWTYRGTRTRSTATSVTLEAEFDRDDEEVHGLTLRKGDRFRETFYADRWYNVFAVSDVDSGRLKGWYCNITRPARLEADAIWAEDLALDLVVLPDGRQAVLDREEFEALDLSPSDRQAALSALAELQSLADARLGPFANG